MRPGVQSAVLGIVLNVVLSLGLIYKFGFAGAVLGTSASLILASGFFISVFHRRTGYPVFRVLQEGYSKPLVTSIVILAVILVIHPTNNLSWFGLVGVGVVFGAFYSIAILLSGFFDEYDWSKIESIMPVVRHARRISRIA
jgi:O-antigen/teichoic acid export membrane protein